MLWAEQVPEGRHHFNLCTSAMAPRPYSLRSTFSAGPSSVTRPRERPEPL
jgi:hypothetical protein